MLRLWIIGFISGFCIISCQNKSDPIPSIEPCVEGKYFNDQGAVFYVTCPDLDAIRCKNALKIVIEVDGYYDGVLIKLIVISISATSVEKLERTINMEGQKFQLEFSHLKSEPTKHLVTLELPPSNCTVNNELELYSYEVVPICGGQVDLIFDIVCEDI